MLAPYFGTSHFVWTAQIAVTLLALASGYALGGRLADRQGALAKLFQLVLAAAAYLALSLLFTKPLAFVALDGTNLPVGSLLVSCALFFPPLTALAASGPILVRALTREVREVGSRVGVLSAVSTAGSVAGTLLVSYAMIPNLANSTSMGLTAGGLAAWAVVFFLRWGRLQSSQTVLLALLVVGLVGGSRTARLSIPEGHVLVDEVNSPFGVLQVIDDDLTGHRFYLNDYLIQNTYSVDEERSVNLFTYMLELLAVGYTERLDNVLCIGLGVGMTPSAIAARGAQVEVIEINPKIVEVAERYFGFDPGRVQVVIGDGRHVIKKGESKYDAIVLDAFLGDASPSHLMTREAFSEMKERMTDEAVLVINSFGNFTPGKDFFTASLDQTLRAVFQHVKIQADGNGNVFFVAGDVSLDHYRRHPTWNHAPDFLQTRIRNVWDSDQRVAASHGMVLTDNYNPVEFRDADNREAIRRDLALSMASR